MRLLNNLDLNKNELQNARIQSLASAPGSPVEGQIYFDTTLDRVRVYDGAAWQSFEQNVVTAVSGTGPIQVASSGTTRTVSIDPASGSTAGSMSITHFSLVNGATAANTASTLVLRDASGNFTAGTITAALTGTASNASQLNGQNASYYTNFANTTGQRTATSAISDFDTQVRTSRLDQMAAPTSAVSLNSQRITAVADPTTDTDAANKRYVDNARQGLDAKDSVRVATTANGALATAFANGQVVDGITLVTGDRILIKNQTTASENGIYTVNATGAPTRAVDADSNGDLSLGTIVFVEAGTTNGQTQQALNTVGATPWVPGTTTTGWTQFSGANSISAGNGLTASGQVFNVVGTTSRISVSADAIDIASDYVGQTSITTLGTVTSGTWSASTIVEARGGTGQTTYTTGDLLQATGANTLGKLAAVATGNVLISGGVGAVSSWGKVGLTTHVSGTLAVGNGGTGATTLTSNGVLLGAGTGAITATVAGSANQVLRVPSGGGAPAFGSIDIASSAVVGTAILPIANGGTNATAANYTSGKFLAYDGTRFVSTTYDQASFATAAHTHAAAAGKYATAIGDGTAVNYVVTHNLGTQDVQVVVYEAASPWAQVYPDIEHTSTTTATIRFAVAPTAGQYRVVVVG